MSAESKPSFINKAAESTQRFNIVASGAALVGSMIGLIPVGFTLTFIEFNALTYIGAEALKEKKN